MSLIPLPLGQPLKRQTDITANKKVTSHCYRVGETPRPWQHGMAPASASWESRGSGSTGMEYRRKGMALMGPPCALPQVDQNRVLELESHLGSLRAIPDGQFDLPTTLSIQKSKQCNLPPKKKKKKNAGTTQFIQCPQGKKQPAPFNCDVSFLHIHAQILTQVRPPRVIRQLSVHLCFMHKVI